MKSLHLKIFLFSILFISLTSKSKAQDFAVGGRIISKIDSLPLISANILLIHLPDSVQQGMVTNEKGFFRFKTLEQGNYILKISYTGYQSVIKEITYSGQPIVFRNLALEEGNDLNEFVLEEKIPISTQNGDTTSFNAGAFKVNPDATAEDLVNKMPGVTLQDGKLQVQGENVGKILIDGKPYMGDDPNAALKNLPADVIGKIQVFDQKSDQAQFTGVDDGNTTKTINIVTKPEFRNGNYGKIFAGYGTDNRYKAGGSYNSIKDARRINILAQSNSINEQNFSSEDLGGIVSSSASSGGKGGGGPRGGGGGNWNSPAGDFLVDQNSGINTSHAFGFNFTNAWNKKTDLTFSYFFNLSDNNTLGTLFRQYVLPSDSGLTYTEENFKTSRNINHRASVRFNVQLDSMKSILFTPKFSFQSNSGENEFNGINAENDFTVSDLFNLSESDYTGLNFSFPVLYKHKLKKRGRTFSLQLTPGYSMSDGTNILNSNSNYYSDTSALIVNQSSLLNQTGFNWNSNLSYTEAIGEKGIMEFNYITAFNTNDSDKETYQYDIASSDYIIPDTSLSNVFRSDYLSNKFGLSYKYNNQKMSVSIGAAYQLAQLKNKQEFPFNSTLTKNFQSILPNAMLMYRFSKTKNLRIHYRSSNNAPSVSQLQDVINNNNTLQLSKGNPNLNQDFQNSIFARYSANNSEKSTSFFAMIGGTYTTNYIGKSTLIATQDSILQEGIILQEGSQLSFSENLDGQYSIRSFINYGFPIKKIKSILNLGLSGTFSRTPGLINNSLNYANSTNGGVNITLSSNISEKIDFTISSNTSISSIKNTLQSDLNSNYYNQNSRFRLSLNPWKGLFIQTELIHQYNGGLSSGYNANFSLLGGAIAYKFLKNQSGDLRISVFDLLKQNTSIKRSTTDIYIEDSYNTILQQYFMLTFTYTFKNFKESGTVPASKTN